MSKDTFYYTPFTLHVVSPMVTHVWWNVPVLGSLPGICLQTCDSVSHYCNPRTSPGSFEKFKNSWFDFRNVSMHRWFHAGACEFLTTVNEGVASVYKVVTCSSFNVTRQHWKDVLVILPRICPTATEGESRLMEVASQWPTFVVLSSYCCWQLKNCVQ